MGKVNLNFAQKMKVVDWIRAHKRELHETRPPWEEIKTKMVAVLGVPYESLPAASAFQRIARDSGLGWVPCTKGTRPKTSNKQVLEMLKTLSYIVCKITEDRTFNPMIAGASAAAHMVDLMERVDAALAVERVNENKKTQKELALEDK